MRKKRIGRPPLPKGERQAAVVTVRMSKAERKVIGHAAKAAGHKKLSDWIRITLLAAAKPATVESGERKMEDSNPALVKTAP